MVARSTEFGSRRAEEWRNLEWLDVDGRVDEDVLMFMRTLR
jgi:hypothetical protein